MNCEVIQFLGIRMWGQWTMNGNGTNLNLICSWEWPGTKAKLCTIAVHWLHILILRNWISSEFINFIRLQLLWKYTAFNAAQTSTFSFTFYLLFLASRPLNRPRDASWTRHTATSGFHRGLAAHADFWQRKKDSSSSAWREVERTLASKRNIFCRPEAGTCLHLDFYERAPWRLASQWMIFGLHCPEPELSVLHRGHQTTAT